MLVVSAVAGGGVALVVAPRLFHQHLARAGETQPSTVRHVEEAFVSTGWVTLSMAALAALVVAVPLSWWVSRRVTRSLEAAGTAATVVARGRPAPLIDETHGPAEARAMATAFNSMSGQLAATEETRRRMLADLGHELRTPISTLQAHLEGLEDGVIPADAETFAVLQRQLDRLTRLTEDIRTVSLEDERIPLRRKQIDLAELARSVGELPREGAERIVVDTPQPQPVWVDPARIEQVLTNLLDNAVRHTGAGDTITVTVDGDDREVRLSVADTGDGIAAEQLPHVFERFYRTDAARDSAHGGSGIGLSISRSIAHAHGGSLTATSDGPGEGARFVLSLPRSP
ncbi:HAMP domain-containing histidine kinase [Calidifontibacter sp. DB0510]|uniref:histidine kinase n=1 Tax=Metallococcus carri TaxID=1656884 RepID=A0A967AZN2_9MICO|nr:HAMP domain-containing sensor histidine kinase [Metallococcus carri]NHN55628.1 HAMP domain-containing histidine kinase [Metallococcus carri]NOP38188.1 HAMP domain-containing histidine kinase [Calidifontibacter sp. DB2511S]